jgi:hypothetical protein
MFKVCWKVVDSNFTVSYLFNYGIPNISTQAISPALHVCLGRFLAQASDSKTLEISLLAFDAFEVLYFLVSNRVQFVHLVKCAADLDIFLLVAQEMSPVPIVFLVLFRMTQVRLIKTQNALWKMIVPRGGQD